MKKRTLKYRVPLKPGRFKRAQRRAVRFQLDPLWVGLTSDHKWRYLEVKGISERAIWNKAKRILRDRFGIANVRMKTRLYRLAHKT